jgi:thiosulfate/3-mercaptopyruvate sulfurtransferase
MLPSRPAAAPAAFAAKPLPEAGDRATMILTRTHPEVAMAGFANPHYLVETEWLAVQLEDPAIRVFDCTTSLVPDPKTVYRIENSRPAYDAGHIPGAGYLDLQGELSDPTSELRFTLPPPAQFAAAISAKGVGDGDRVILYSQANIWWATRVWWMFRAMGFDRVAVLNGGLVKWMAEGRPLSTEPSPYPPGRFTARPRLELVARKDEVLAAIGDGRVCLINALSPRQHAGTSGTHYGRPGRIAGSVNLPGTALIDPATNAYLSADELRRQAAAVGALDAARVITYCGGGIAATNDAFVLALLGRDDHPADGDRVSAAPRGVTASRPCRTTPRAPAASPGSWSGKPRSSSGCPEHRRHPRSPPGSARSRPWR